MEFRHGNACRSFAGRDGQRQEIILAPFCAEEHTLIHEVTFLSFIKQLPIRTLNIYITL